MEGQVVKDALREAVGAHRAADVVGDDDELITAESGHRVPRAVEGLQAPADQNEHVIAHKVFEGVIDGLGPIEVDEHQGDGPLPYLPPRRRRRSSCLTRSSSAAHRSRRTT